MFGVDGIVKDRWNLKCSSCTRTKPKGHGAPVQCTKGKCPKAFHVSCARDNYATVFEVMREVEKEVILMDQAAPSMEVDSITGVPTERNDQVLKVIKKLEVQILCTQHNPAVAAEKKASKQEKIKKELMALPTMSRIKIRVSAGVFEVSLIRVVEETGSVEVLWDRGLRKEFKWGSVVFGSTDGPVHQKPSEPAPEPLVPQSVPPGSHLSVPLRSPTQSAPPASSTPVQAVVNSATSQPLTSYSVPYYQQRTSYNYWPYGTGQTSYTGYSYPYGGYYANVPMNGTTQYTPYVYSQQYRGGQLQWQQPYQGPRQGVLSSSGDQVLSDTQTAEPNQVTEEAPARQCEQVQPSTAGSTPTETLAGSTSQSQSTTTPLSEATSPTQSTCLSSASTSLVPAPQQTAATAGPDADNTEATQSTFAPTDGSQQAFTLTSEMEQAILRNLHALSVMQPTQLADLLQTNPQLQAVLAAMDQAKSAVS